MNLILFTPEEIERPLSRHDPRARHVLEVLRRREHETFDVGLLNGPRGKATLTAIAPDALHLAFTWGSPTPLPDAIALVIGMPRPQTARDILRDATTVGVAALHFVKTEKTEASYVQSTLWREGEWQRHVRAGAEQAFDTRVPAVTHGASLETILAELPASTARVALDNYEATASLATAITGEARQSLVLAFGPERGWSNGDRLRLRQCGFTLAHLGARVLRLETAVTAALALAKATRGTW